MYCNYKFEIVELKGEFAVVPIDKICYWAANDNPAEINNCNLATIWSTGYAPQLLLSS
jgi:hypothetical protein